MPALSKRDADAHDRVMEAAMRLADLLESQGIEMDEYALEEITIHLATNAGRVRNLLRNCTMTW